MSSTSRPAGLTAFLICLVAAAAFVLASGGAAQAGLTVRNLLADNGEDSNEKPGGTVLIIGARNGAFSGKVAVRGGRITRAAVSDLKGQGGTISAGQMRLRYAVPWGKDLSGRSKPRGCDILLEAPPAEGSGDVDLWITVAVPKQAKAGTYKGSAAIQASGGSASVPVELRVADWTLPDLQDYRTWVELMQSPDTLVAEYKVPLWSDRHWELIGQSLKLIGETGSRVVYVPLICHTNYGNEESMVRWVKKGGNRYEHDFSIMEKYLDLAEKHLGRPKMVVLYVWDVYLKPSEGPVEIKESDSRHVKTQKEYAAARWALRDSGPAVTVVDGGRVENVHLPKYTAPGAKALWQPLWAGLIRRLRERGLEGVAMLGLVSDHWPTREQVSFLHQVSGGLPWVSHAHNGLFFRGKSKLYGVAELGYDANVWAFKYVLDPAKERAYGWKEPGRVATYHRGGFFNTARHTVLRNVAEQNITGNQHGVGRIGADMWYAIKDKRGKRVGTVGGRYPQSYWRNLNILSWLLAPGPEGPVGTARLEFFREGVQDCEARIFIEQALTTPKLKARLGSKLSGRAQNLLDERQLAVWKGLGISEERIRQHGLVDGMRSYMSLKLFGEDRRKYESSAGHFWTPEGHKWFVNSDWQKRTEELYALAGEVAGKLGLQVASGPGPASRARAKPAREPPREPLFPRTAARERSPEQVCRGWFSLAANYKRAGMKEQARQYLQKIVDTYPDTEHAEKARQMMKGL